MGLVTLGRRHGRRPLCHRCRHVLLLVRTAGSPAQTFWWISAFETVRTLPGSPTDYTRAVPGGAFAGPLRSEGLGKELDDPGPRIGSALRVVGRARVVEERMLRPGVHVVVEPLPVAR